MVESRQLRLFSDVFWAFIDRSGNRNERLFPKRDNKGFYDIHPSPKAGMPVLARHVGRGGGGGGGGGGARGAAAPPEKIELQKK